MMNYIEEIAESLLWENVSNYVERPEELKSMTENLTYIDHSIVNQINSCEVLETEEFTIVKMKEINESIQIEFEMPFILYCWKDKVHLLRISACANGRCEIPNEKRYDYSSVDFSSMNRKELLKYGEIVKIDRVKYSDVEVEQFL